MFAQSIIPAEINQSVSLYIWTREKNSHARSSVRSLLRVIYYKTTPFEVIINFTCAFFPRVCDGAFNTRSRACKTETPFLSVLLDDDDDDDDRCHVYRKHAFKLSSAKGNEKAKKGKKKERRQRERELGKRWVRSHEGQWFIFVLPRTSREGGSLIR